MMNNKQKLIKTTNNTATIKNYIDEYGFKCIKISDNDTRVIICDLKTKYHISYDNGVGLGYSDYKKDIETLSIFLNKNFTTDIVTSILFYLMTNS